MDFRVAFYVHHHGLGHYRRAVQIAEKLIQHQPVLLGSNLKIQSKNLNKAIAIVDLPLDTPTTDDVNYSNGTLVDELHYAPLNINGLSERAAILSDFFAKNGPLILIVDVSVEVTLLARLCGIPTIVIRQHGIRSDPAHLMAYKCAELLIAPYGKNLNRSANKWITKKTLFSGGFSRLDTIKKEDETAPNNQISIIIGKGGSSLNVNTVSKIAAKCQTFTFHVLGDVLDNDKPNLSNVVFYDFADDVFEIITKCSLVIGNTGHNSVMEVASLNKRFIGIPEPRPFDEQLEKAASLKNINGYLTVLPEEIESIDWNFLINKMLLITPNWKNTIDSNALDNIANAIQSLGNKLYHK
ncbi:glycosyltransferase [Pedobacter mucosus]|uniref:glycosyltransferase n=1 Tax=Pedobacter mucosus TaxID=2895286 RepID=UPI001EE48A2B|nr:glycosyltransferase [Pedobacter mucosus]UKT64779.1 hypothetical protein LOK61_03160 [Pedobacter mucosus]